MSVIGLWSADSKQQAKWRVVNHTVSTVNTVVETRSLPQLWYLSRCIPVVFTNHAVGSGTGVSRTRIFLSRSSRRFVSYRLQLPCCIVIGCWFPQGWIGCQRPNSGAMRKWHNKLPRTSKLCGCILWRNDRSQTYFLLNGICHGDKTKSSYMKQPL